MLLFIFFDYLLFTDKKDKNCDVTINFFLNSVIADF